MSIHRDPFRALCLTTSGSGPTIQASPAPRCEPPETLKLASLAARPGSVQVRERGRKRDTSSATPPSYHHTHLRLGRFGPGRAVSGRTPAVASGAGVRQSLLQIARALARAIPA